MSNPRTEALAAVRESEAQIRAIPDLLTLGAIAQLKIALQAVAETQRRTVEWIDAIEI